MPAAAAIKIVNKAFSRHLAGLALVLELHEKGKGMRGSAAAPIKAATKTVAKANPRF